MKILNKYFLLVIFILSLTSCQQGKPDENKVASFDWIVGDWKRSNEQAGKVTYEYWQKKSAKAYIGLGCTISAGDTTFREDLKIYRDQNAWWLEVTGTDNKPVAFRIVAVQKTGLNAENKNNEFPKYIKYRLADKQLKAFVADDQNEIEFVFEPIK